MNRYAADGIAEDAERGRRVLVVCTAGHTTRAAFDAVAALTPGAKLTRAAHRLAIEAEGAGGVYFIPRSMLYLSRGMSFDIVYFDTGVDNSSELRANLEPGMATSTVAEFIR